ncbi:MAG: pyruvate ferredoxin oxidoreductase, partial [Eggerthellaceae bacterium]|nr:pyruvate ferredoxin oxidoreductase [Eggerthellaceae bacterium]
LEVTSALYDAGLTIPVNDYVVGLGGADITLDQMNEVYMDLKARAEGADNGSLTYLGVEE